MSLICHMLCSHTLYKLTVCLKQVDNNASTKNIVTESDMAEWFENRELILIKSSFDVYHSLKFYFIFICNLFFGGLLHQVSA